jgi:predicted GTPase
VTDSQDFKTVYELKPEESRLTSFSVLFARWKGDIDEFIRGAEALSSLDENSRVLIAEACSHAPLAEDIGREKIPALIRKKINPNIKFDIISGNDWNVNFSEYDLIIHCGACMFSRSQMLNRINDVKKHKIKITNYGITIAYLNSIINKITW